MENSPVKTGLVSGGEKTQFFEMLHVKIELFSATEGIFVVI